ncbi:MAG TPA: hypothetical protein VEL68_05795 [Thermodesulfobacteriota bacterium]|nr:hypothetical protein [Thermodesulfobacteriota bacterium]
MKRLLLFLGYGAAALTILFALALPIKGFPVFLSALGNLGLKIAPWYSGGEVASTLDRGSYQIKVYHPVYPALVGEGEKGFVQLVWQPRSALPPRVQEEIDLNGDGKPDCEVSFSNPPEEAGAPLLTVNPKSPWVSPVHNSPTTSFEGILVERVKDAMYVRIPLKKMGSS